MMHISHKDAKRHDNAPTCTVYEYGDNGKSDLARAVISGRYPVEHFAMNELSDMTVFVLSGGGRIVTRESSAKLEPGDAFFISSNEAYFFEGESLELIMCSNPVWSPRQYKEIV